MFITITGTDYYMGSEAFKINQLLTLIKENDNLYDDESIRVESESGVTLGHVANSVYSVARGTHSAGYIYNTFKDNATCKVLFICGDKAIAEIAEK